MISKHIVLFLCSISIAFAQHYPRWFLFQGELSCSNISVGIVPTGYYKESTQKNAMQNACEILATYQQSTISGEQAFWATESGTFALDAHYDIVYDTVLCNSYTQQLSVLDYFSSREQTFVLVGDSSCIIDPQLREYVSLKNIPKPEWVEHAPESSAKVYAVGVSEKYAYEVSSWIAAQKEAFKELSRMIRSSQKSVVQSNEREQHDLRFEEVNVSVQHVRVEARWLDSKRKIYYVLLSMQK